MQNILKAVAEGLKVSQVTNFEYFLSTIQFVNKVIV